MPSVSKLIGNGLSETKIWAGVIQRASAYELNFGCSVKLTCDQDECAIMDAQKEAAALAIMGAQTAHAAGSQQLVKLALEAEPQP